MYKSPIEIIISDMHMKFAESFEQKIVQAIQDIEIHIDKDELIKALKYDRDQYEKGYADGKTESKWIPCSERLPILGEPVLSTTEWNDITIAWRLGIKKWRIHEGNTDAETEDIAAWMPLPEPYNPE